MSLKSGIKKVFGKIGNLFRKNKNNDLPGYVSRDELLARKMLEESEKDVSDRANEERYAKEVIERYFKEKGKLWYKVNGVEVLNPAVQDKKNLAVDTVRVLNGSAIPLLQKIASMSKENARVLVDSLKTAQETGMLDESMIPELVKVYNALPNEYFDNKVSVEIGSRLSALVNVYYRTKSIMEIDETLPEIMEKTGINDPQKLIEITSLVVGNDFNLWKVAEKYDEIDEINQYLNKVAKEQGRAGGVEDIGRTNLGIDALTEYANGNLKPLSKLLVDYSQKVKLPETELPAIQQIKKLIGQTKVGRPAKDETKRPYYKLCNNDQFLYSAVDAMQSVAPASPKDWRKFGKRVRKAGKYLC